MATTTLSLDYETRSEVDLKKSGLDLYVNDRSTKAMLASYSINGGRTQLWDYNDSSSLPSELKDALTDPHVIKWAFNAQFERLITERVLKLNTGHDSWRCTMVYAYLLSFSGTLGEIGAQVGLAEELAKVADGKRLIKLFCGPQKVTKSNQYRWRDALTDPDDWDLFREYCIQDNVSEKAVLDRLLGYPVPASEWKLYSIDQQINDHGFPVDKLFAANAVRMADIRKRQLNAELTVITGLDNPNSRTQLLPWLQTRGYPFNDIQKGTVEKVINEKMADPVALSALAIRQNSARNTTAKYTTLLDCTGDNDRIRYTLQMAGAQRTARWGGRRFQPQNLSRPPHYLEDWALTVVTDMVRADDIRGLELMVGEPMDVLVGCVRSAIRAQKGYEFRVVDLASIESVVIGWLTNCKWFMDNLRAGRDLYKAFAVHVYQVAYEEVTKAQRNNAKPATLGAGYRLGGGTMDDEGKKTGLWGYAENMKINLTKDESHKAVQVFRDLCPEIVDTWFTLERAVDKVLATKSAVVVGRLRIAFQSPFLTITLPSGRRLFYYQPRMVTRTMTGFNGEPYKKRQFSYMGKDQASNRWVRQFSHGGKLVENIVQAMARDVLKAGLIRADDFGFTIAGHVHDEIISHQRIDDDVCTTEALIQCMTETLNWAPDMPLKAEGWAGPFYKKD